MTFLIRAAAADDAGLLAALNVAVQKIHVEVRPDLYKPAEVTDAIVHWFLERLTNPRYTGYIAAVNDDGVGYALTEVIERNETPFTFPSRALLIDQMSINAEHRGKGYGRFLLEYICSQAQAMGIHEVVLGVAGFNDNAQAFYQRCGFHIRDLRYERTLK